MTQQAHTRKHTNTRSAIWRLQDHRDHSQARKEGHVAGQLVNLEIFSDSKTKKKTTTRLHTHGKPVHVPSPAGMGRDSSARCDRFPRSRCHRYTQTLRIVCNGTDQHAATATFFPKYKPWSGKRQLRSSSKDSRLNCCQFGAYGTRCLPNRYPMLDRSALIKAGHKGRKKTGHEWVRSEWHQRQDTHTHSHGAMAKNKSCGKNGNIAKAPVRYIPVRAVAQRNKSQETVRPHCGDPCANLQVFLF